MVNSCCCCVKVKTGTLILSIIVTLSLFQEIEEWNPIRFGFNLACASIFLWQLVKDTEQKRMVFAITYIVCKSVQYLFAVYMAFEKVDEEKPWNQACEDVKKQGNLKSFTNGSMDECREKMRNIINTAMTFFFVLLAVMEIHFMMVVYSHYKNWKNDQEDKARHVLQDETNTV